MPWGFLPRRLHPTETRTPLQHKVPIRTVPWQEGGRRSQGQPSLRCHGRAGAMPNQLMETDEAARVSCHSVASPAPPLHIGLCVTAAPARGGLAAHQEAVRRPQSLLHDNSPLEATLEVPQVRASLRHQEPLALVRPRPPPHPLPRRGHSPVSDIPGLGSAGASLWTGHDLRPEDPDRVPGSGPFRGRRRARRISRCRPVVAPAGAPPPPSPYRKPRSPRLRRPFPPDRTKRYRCRPGPPHAGGVPGGPQWPTGSAA